jgi:hypothetical protein
MIKVVFSLCLVLFCVLVHCNTAGLACLNKIISGGLSETSIYQLLSAAAVRSYVVGGKIMQSVNVFNTVMQWMQYEAAFVEVCVCVCVCVCDGTKQ